MMKWILGRHGWIVPVLVLLLFVAAVLFMDGQLTQRQMGAHRDAAAVADRRAALLADELGNAVGRHIGALTAAKLKFTPVDDEVSEQLFTEAVDTVIAQLGGITAISVIDPAASRLSRGTAAGLGRWGLDPFSDTVVANPYRRVLATRAPAATGLIELPIGRRVILFDPVLRGDTIVGVLAGELEPAQVLRSALVDVPTDSLRGLFYALHGPTGERITAVPSPADWPAVERPVRVADTEWHLRLAYPPIGALMFRAERIALWVGGLTFGLGIAGLLMLMRNYYLRQREEIARRKKAEEAAQQSAAMARARAAEARELAVQLEAAQRAAQRLSTSLNPDDVVELFLGGVAEILEADVATLYTFEEEGELLVGRQRIVFHDVGPVTERLRSEDIRQVRAPAALLPGLAEAVATGEPFVQHAQGVEGRVSEAGVDTPASVTIPLLVAGHMVGVASWEVYGQVRHFETSKVTFAQALAAPAAAALRTAELFASLETASGQASREAARFRTVLDQMADGVVVVDVAGRVERSNKAAGELLGADIVDLPLEEWGAALRITNVDGRSFQPQDFPLLRALRGERVHRTNFIAHGPGGVERFLSVSAGPIVASSGEPAGAALVFRDVTDEHQYAEMLRHTNRELRQQAEVLEQVNQQLRAATKAKDQFLAVMSHELRTPINAIMGYSDLLDLGVKGSLNAEQKTMVTRVRDTSRHLLGLINEVLDLAKIGAGQIDLVMAEVDVNEIVRRAAEQILPLATAKGLSLTVEVEQLSGGRPLLVVADETRFTQIVINLLSNAVKFTQTGGVEATCRREGEKVLLRVKDTGPGIPENERERIFDEFYQVDSGLSRNIGGTGLGLAIARRFARLMGADIRVESEPGQGSEFIVELEAIGPHHIRRPADDQARVVLLAAADDLISIVDAALNGQVQVAATTDPAIVAALARQQHPALVILDTAASEFGAWRALGSLQTDPQTAGLRTMLIARDPADASQAVDLGFFTTMTKPIAVQRAVQTVLGAAGRNGAPVVLIADDDADVRRILTEALSAAGCTVETAASGPQAIRTMVAVPPDVAVLDLLAPRLLGPDMLARIRANPELKDTTILMLGVRELSAEAMAHLQLAATRLTRSREVSRRDIADLLREACERAAEAVHARALSS